MDIYLIINLINGKKYVGQTINLKNRIRGHRGGYGNSLIAKAIRKHGWENFAVVILEQEIDTHEKLNELEILHIHREKSMVEHGGYNLCTGGSGTSGFKPSCETKEKQRASKIGKKLSPEHRLKIGEGNRLWERGIECRQKISQSLRSSLKNKCKRKPLSGDHKSILSSIKSKEWIVTTPLGETIEVTNLRKFCMENHLSSSAMCRVSKNMQSNHKGYRVVAKIH